LGTTDHSGEDNPALLIPWVLWVVGVSTKQQYLTNIEGQAPGRHL